MQSCSELNFESKTQQLAVDTAMSLATWIECFSRMFEDACNNYVEDTWKKMVNGETTQTLEGKG